MNVPLMIAYLQKQAQQHLDLSRHYQGGESPESVDLEMAHAYDAAMNSTICELLQSSCQWTPMTDDAVFTDRETYLLRVSPGSYVSAMYNAELNVFMYGKEVNVNMSNCGYRDDFTHYRSIGDPE